jgi:hypothetical protein
MDIFFYKSAFFNKKLYTHFQLPACFSIAIWEGYPVALLADVLRNANGLGIVTGMQAAVLSECQLLQKQILELAGRLPECMPPPL